MGLPHRQWCFLSYVRIFDSGAEQNNTIRVQRDGSAAETVEIDAGVYYLGVNGDGDTNSLETGCWTGDDEDSSVFTGKSLLEIVTEELNALTTFASNEVNLGLETGSSLAGAQVASGKVICKSKGVDDIDFLWGDALTTMDPAWFGVAKSSGSFVDTTITGAGTEYLGTMSSTLALVGEKVLGQETQYEGYLEAGIMSSDRSTSWKTFGDGYEQISEFRVNVEGMARASHANGFHSLRRWSQKLRLNRARRRFIYIPDLSYAATAPPEWDPDDQEEAYLWGWRELCLDPLKSYRFENMKRFGQGDNHWQLTIPVRTFVA